MSNARNKRVGRTPMSEKNKETVVAFIKAMSSGDVAGADACLAPDAYTIAKGFSKFAGKRDHAMIVGTIAAFNDLLEPGGLRPEIKTVTGDGDRVAVEFEGHAVTKGGEPYPNQYCMVFTLKDGKIKTVHEYFCTILADRVLWPVVEAAMGPQA
jgi:ketosteroid isomerase-like protein